MRAETLYHRRRLLLRRKQNQPVFILFTDSKHNVDRQFSHFSGNKRFCYLLSRRVLHSRGTTEHWERSERDYKPPPPPPQTARLIISTENGKVTVPTGAEEGERVGFLSFKPVNLNRRARPGSEATELSSDLGINILLCTSFAIQSSYLEGEMGECWNILGVFNGPGETLEKKTNKKKTTLVTSGINIKFMRRI